ncbi:unnamed protein product [Colias eurytheme]|nr:unnamed protein product [Colias eurytheme]
MPTQARCDRVPPADGVWGAVDLRVLQEDDLPLDPRTWCRAHVAAWVSRRGGLPERFPMNGKALCLMSRDMFLYKHPRTWCRAHVAAWVSRRGGLPERFPMNGKALCLMSRDMFSARVPCGGDALHQDFRRRLAKALALQELLEKLGAK